ncbi:tetratricopeptide repeat-containing sensor histidine kinase [Reichenbachiella carrageenanivorans]|uniref:histidine kinase n=1 Tax=Reichenbachiella carrageenanivorans TaxID=2979869 RepID=A0ABY6CYR3_9BACT|nr:tetratricopeptide repeat-containing sensor histidine kinase [Reichenbachiella carrageenanivorans]UXX79052.1 tetratricopeptide repeat-containing sensor histidine kinase [Reichenbachiella carrageenanivorans]
MASSDLYKSKGDSCANVLDYEHAVQYYEQALRFDEQDSSLQVYLNLHNLIGGIYYKQGFFIKADKQFGLVLQVAGEHQYYKEKATALMGQSHILWRYGDNVASIEKVLSSIDLFKSLADTVQIVEASNILGGIYLSTGEISKAKEIYEETLAIAMASMDSAGMASSLEYHGVIKYFENDMMQAIKYYNSSLAINLKIKNELDAGITYGNLAEAYLRMNDYKQALEYLSISEDILLRHNFNSGLIFTNSCIGESWVGLRNYKQAHERYNKSLELIALTGELREKPRVLALISACFATEGKYYEAYQVHQDYAIAQDSFNIINQNEKLMNIMSKYEFEKKEQENLFLQKENQIKELELASKQSVIKFQYLAGGVLIFFLIITLYLFVRLYKNKVLLDQSNQAKDKLFGFIAHDIKSPLANIQMMVQMLDQGLDLDKSERSKFLSGLSESASSVVQLTDDLIAWSLAHQRGIELKPTNVLIGEVVKETLDLFRTQIQFKKIEVDSDILPYISARVDQKAFSFICRNVISNAIKFSERGGEISIRVVEIEPKGKKGAMVGLKIRDEGVGMTKDQVAQLLSEQIYESTRGTVNEKGSGLGLNMVKEFVEKSNGHIKIKSKPGEGTKFSVFLPTDTD